MADAQVSVELFAGVSILITVGSAWAHHAVKLDRLTRHSQRHARCIKRIRLRLAKAERWLPPK